MKRQIYTLLSVLLLGLFLPNTLVHAAEKEADQTPKIIVVPTPTVAPIDLRPRKLRKFLESYNSPLAEKADVFVREADANKIDYRWVAMILGVESTFGKHIPPGSYNGWGWGIPTGAQSGIGFTSWEHGIATVTKGLSTRYVARGLDTIEKIGPVYAASPEWARKVNFFLDKYEKFEVSDPKTLGVTL